MPERERSEPRRTDPRAFVARSLRALSDPQLPQLLRAYALLFIMDLAVRWVGIVPVWNRIMARCRSKLGASGVSNLNLPLLLRSVRCAAAHHLYPMNCLQQSLALAWLLSERGVRSQLRMGVSRDRGSLEAHAWLELDGTAINHPPELTQRFVPLERTNRFATQNSQP